MTSFIAQIKIINLEYPLAKANLCVFLVYGGKVGSSQVPVHLNVDIKWQIKTDFHGASLVHFFIYIKLLWTFITYVYLLYNHTMAKYIRHDVWLVCLFEWLSVVTFINRSDLGGNNALVN